MASLVAVRILLYRPKKRPGASRVTEQPTEAPYLGTRFLGLLNREFIDAAHSRPVD
jgi:hypothetical protein